MGGRMHRFKQLMQSKVTLCVICFFTTFISVGYYHNESVVKYENQLGVLVNYMYEEVTPSEALSVYQTFLNIDSPYQERIKMELSQSLIARYEYYANLYTLRKIEYEEYLLYEQIMTELFPSNDTVKLTIEEVQRYYESHRAYVQGMNLQDQSLIEDAITTYSNVLFNDEYYYELAQVQIVQCIELIKEQYMKMAHQYFEASLYSEAIEQLNFLTERVSDEAIDSLIWYYQSEYYTYLMKEVQRLEQDEQYGYLITYLTKAQSYLDEQYDSTFESILSEAKLLRAQRRDVALSRYSATLGVYQLPESNQQLITYNKVMPVDDLTFDVVSFASKAFTLEKEEIEEVQQRIISEEELADEDERLDESEEQEVTYVNMMPYLMTNDDITSATLNLMFGYVEKEAIHVKQLSVLIDGEELFNYEVSADELRQVIVDDRVIEWVNFTLSDDVIQSLQFAQHNDAIITIAFIGETSEKEVVLDQFEVDLVQMIIEVYDAIMK